MLINGYCRRRVHVEDRRRRRTTHRSKASRILACPIEEGEPDPGWPSEEGEPDPGCPGEEGEPDPGCPGEEGDPGVPVCPGPIVAWGF